MIPFKLYKEGRHYIKIKAYPNFVLYQELKSGVLECFSYFELGSVPETPKIREANKRGAVNFI